MYRHLLLYAENSWASKVAREMWRCIGKDSGDPPLFIHSDRELVMAAVEMSERPRFVQDVEEVVERTKEQNLDASRLRITAHVVLAHTPAATGSHGVQDDLRWLRESSKLGWHARSHACLTENCDDMRRAQWFNVVGF